jgi:predicted ArsR family transcriptional regulator
MPDVYPHVPGWKGTETSLNAAQSIEPIAKTILRKAERMFKALGSDGATAEEMAERLGVPRVTVQPRVSELRRLGKVRDSGQRRRNPSSGKSAVVWVIAGDQA